MPHTGTQAGGGESRAAVSSASCGSPTLSSTPACTTWAPAVSNASKKVALKVTAKKADLLEFMACSLSFVDQARGGGRGGVCVRACARACAEQGPACMHTAQGASNPL